MYETPFNLGKAIPLLACLGDVMGLNSAWMSAVVTQFYVSPCRVK